MYENFYGIDNTNEAFATDASDDTTSAATVAISFLSLWAVLARFFA